MIAGTTQTASAPSDVAAGSLGRCPDGHDTNDGSVDFASLETSTPGALKACP